MLETRRAVVMTMAAAAGSLAVADVFLFAQRPLIPPPPPQPAETRNPAEIRTNPQDAAAKRTILRQNEHEFRVGVYRLYQLTGELRDELQKTSTTDVLYV